MNNPQPWGPLDLKPFAEFPDRITRIQFAGDKIIVETTRGLYEVLQDGTYIGFTFD